MKRTAAKAAAAAEQRARRPRLRRAKRAPRLQGAQRRRQPRHRRSAATRAPRAEAGADAAGRAEEGCANDDADDVGRLATISEVEAVDELDAEPDRRPTTPIEIDADGPDLEDVEDDADADGRDSRPAADEDAVAEPAKARRGSAAEDEEIAEPTEKDKASGDFVWDEDESEALRQARKDAELTASADSVRAYLKQIGKVALLNAEEEVELAKRIEAGLYATQLMTEFDRARREAARRPAPRHDRGSAATATARKTICWKPTCDWWCRWPSATPAAAWRSST